MLATYLHDTRTYSRERLTARVSARVRFDSRYGWTSDGSRIVRRSDGALIDPVAYGRGAR